MHTQIQARSKQSGVMLLEALIAILIFSMGILAIVGMQATAIQDMGEAKYRSDAAFLANQITAEMWGNATSLASYAYPGSGAVPAQVAPWVSTVQARLPGATTYPPIIAFVAATNQVTVTVRWQAARDKAASAAPHQFQSVAYITCCL
jgi:type IV pilus assembly protein PilV